MAALKLKFHFTTSAVAENTFFVLDFQGREALSELFQFDLVLASAKRGLDPATLLGEPATFTIASQSGTLPFCGVLTLFCQEQQVQNYVLYRARLTSPLARLAVTAHNQIFLDKTLQQFLDLVLTDGGLAPDMDFSFKLVESYPSREYVCQYNESHFAFISRWMEREGLYYFFDQTPQGQGKLVVTDTNTAHTTMPRAGELRYAPPSGLQAAHGDEIATAFSLKQSPMPRNVRVKDWNYRTPDMEVQGAAAVDPNGRGEFFYYGDHLLTPTQGERLAKVRAQELLCRQERYQGQSSAPFLRAGFTVTLTNHYREDFNQEYLITGVEHRGSQRSYLTQIMNTGQGQDESILYDNTFTAIPARVQFRPQRITAWPRFSGVMHAHIDAAGSGEYAEVDEQGRYKVVLPFDLSGRKDGLASSWVRMAQPYGGADHGLHFPLHKGAEVLLACEEGDPDRPLILAAAPNPLFPSLVTEKNQTQSRITTGSGNAILLEDLAGQQHILLHSPKQESYVRLGAVADPPSQSGGNGPDAGAGNSAVNVGSSEQGDENATSTGEHSGDESTEHPGEGEKEKPGGFAGAQLITSNALTLKGGESAKVIFGDSSETYLGLDVAVVGGLSLTLIMGVEIAITVGPHENVTPLKDKYFTDKNVVKANNDLIVGAAKNLTGEMQELTNEITSLKVELEELSTNSTSLAGEVTTLAQERIKLAESNTKLAAEVTEIAMQSTELSQSNQLLAQEIVELGANVNVLSEEVTELCQQKTKLAGTVTALCQEQTELLEEVNIIAADCNNMAMFVNLM